MGIFDCQFKKHFSKDDEKDTKDKLDDKSDLKSLSSTQTETTLANPQTASLAPSEPKRPFWKSRGRGEGWTAFGGSAFDEHTGKEKRGLGLGDGKDKPYYSPGC